MELKIIETTNKEIWENFLLECQEKTFLQSWNWAEFQKKEGNKIWRWGIYDNENLTAVALVIKIEAKRGTFLFVPHGPIIKIQDLRLKIQALIFLLNKLKETSREEKASFIRIAPIFEKNDENIKIFKDLGFKNAPIHMHPEVTWELDVTSSEEDLLMGMRKTTRYLIRQAQKNNDIQITQTQNPEDLKIFNNIYKKTASRHHFVPFSLKYLEDESSSFRDDNQILIFLGKYKNEVVACNMIVYWQNRGFYHQGASLSKYNKIPVSYLMQWEAIKEAKKRGCQLYNFWGIAPTDDENHPWAGLSLFKKGFGGRKKEYVKTQDLPLSRKYFLTYIFEKLRKAKRGL